MLLLLVHLMWLSQGADSVDVEPVPPRTGVNGIPAMLPGRCHPTTRSVSWSLPPKHSTGAWVYDMDGGSPGMWAHDLQAYNDDQTYYAYKSVNGKVSNRSDPEVVKVSVVFLPGGKFVFSDWAWDEHSNKWNAPTSKVTFKGSDAAEAYKDTLKDTLGKNPHIVAVIEGKMDGGHASSPDLSKRSYIEVVSWADKAAAVYCSFPIVHGLQVELTPITEPYATNLLLFINRLSSNLRSRERNCVSKDHPHGRSISVLGYAEDATTEMWDALGPNGYFMMKGFGLKNPSSKAGDPINRTEYSEQFRKSLTQMNKSATEYNGTFTVNSASYHYKGSFMVGIPAAGTANEFEAFTTEEGEIVSGAELSQVEYVNAAITESRLQSLCDNPQFLGFALRGFQSADAYPQLSPSHPFATSASTVDGMACDQPKCDAMVKYLKENLGCDQPKCV